MDNPRKSLFKGLLYWGSDVGRPMLEAALATEGATRAEAARKGRSIVSLASVVLFEKRCDERSCSGRLFGVIHGSIYTRIGGSSLTLCQAIFPLQSLLLQLHMQRKGPVSEADSGTRGHHHERVGRMLLPSQTPSLSPEKDQVRYGERALCHFFRRDPVRRGCTSVAQEGCWTSKVKTCIWRRNGPDWESRLCVWISWTLMATLFERRRWEARGGGELRGRRIRLTLLKLVKWCRSALRSNESRIRRVRERILAAGAFQVVFRLGFGGGSTSHHLVVSFKVRIALGGNCS